MQMTRGEQEVTRVEKIIKALRHGLSLKEEPSSPEESRFIELLAEKAKEHRFEFLLLAFVEGLRPASTVASSILIGLEPFAEIFLPKETYSKLISFVANRENLDKLIAKLGNQDS